MNIIDIISEARDNETNEYIRDIYDTTLTLLNGDHNQELEVLKTLLYTKEIQQYINKPYVQKHPMRIPIVVDKSDTIFSYPIRGDSDFSPISKYEFTELVDKSSEQKIAFKVLPILEKAEEIKEYLIQYLAEEYSHINREVSMTEVTDNGNLGYEIIAYNSVVSNTEERIKFIEEFKKYLSEINEQLPAYIIMNSTFAADESYDRWKSINALKTAEMFDLSREKLVNVIDSDGKSIIINVINNVKNITNAKTLSQYIYLIKEREFVRTGENIYKLGKSKQINCRRVASYPKNSRLITIIPCNHCTLIEKELLAEFRKMFIPRIDIGAEYFEGDVYQMLEVMYKNIIEKFKLT